MLKQVLITELLKLRRTKITWVSWLAYSILPAVGGLFMWIAKEPQRAEQLGLLGQKARFAGVTADWTSYFGLLLQTTGIGGMILVAVIAAFVFGREYSDGTAKNMLVLPVKRYWFTIAKIVVVVIWFLALTISLLVEGFLVGFLMRLPGFSATLAAASIMDVFLAALVAWMLVPAVAWIATLGRGYLAPMGFAIFMLVLGNVFGATGWGKWFPWSIVPLFAGVAGPRVETLASGSFVVLGLTFVAGITVAILQMQYSDNTQ